MNLSPSPLLNAEQRAWDYWFADGLTNVVAGLSCLLMSFCLLYPPHWPPKPGPMLAWSLALWFYSMVTLKHRRIVEWLKSRTTYPRTGYAQTPEEAVCPAPLTTLLHGSTANSESEQVRLRRRKTMYLMLGLFVISALVELVAIRQRWVWLASSLVIAAGVILARKHFRMSWIVPVGFVVLGMSMSLFSPPLQKAPALFLVGWGVIFLLDGMVTLIRYLLRNPAPKVPAA